MSAWRAVWHYVVVAALGAALIGARQADLASRTFKVKQREDVILVPPPDELRVMTLGYDAAAVDYLWGKLLVEYGTHVLAKSPLEVERYLDAILALEPDYAPLFRYVDTLVAYRPRGGKEVDAWTARKYLKQGTEARPYDHRVWMQYGQFVAFLGPSFLASEEERDRWRQEGAKAIARAVELGGDTDRSLSAAGVMMRFGDRDATIRHLRKAYALTDDENLQRDILQRLAALSATRERDEAESDAKLLDQQRRREAPFLKQPEFRVLGPFPDTSTCAGLEGGTRPECATTWAEARERRQFFRLDP
jgi:hypothetical protein